MRLFVAVTLDDHARSALARSVAELRAYLEHAGRGGASAVKWVEPRHLHLTLHFLGEIDDRRVPSLVAALEEPFPMAPFELGLGGWGLFPSKGPARVVWIGVTSGAPALATLHRLAGERLTRQRLQLEPRPLSPHLTVGRVKTSVAPAWRDAVLAAPPPEAVTCRVDHATLYQSRLSPEGPTYLAQARTVLHP